MTSLLRPGPAYHLIASVAALAVFGLIPAALYMHAGDAWEFPPSALLRLAGAGLVGLLLMALAIRALAVISTRAAVILATVLFCLGAFLLLAHVYAPIQIGVLDGSKLISDEPLGYTLLELAALVGLVAVGVQLVRGRGLAVAGLFAAALWLIAAGYAGTMAWTSPGTSPASRSPERATAATATGGNVYHILLDTMQTDAFLLMLERLDLADRFTGFDLFENNVSNYINTTPSSASYLSGTFYYTGKYKKWARAWRTNGLFRIVRDAGYETWMFAPSENWRRRNDYVDHFASNIGIYEEELGIDQAGWYDFSYVWLASLAPNLLTNEALPLAARLSGALFGDLGDGAPRSVEDGIAQYGSSLMLQRLTREEPQRRANGQYVYAHALLPHGPFVLDPNCRYRGRQEARKQRDLDKIKKAYLDHVQCAIRLVVAFLDQLRALDRYDQATIIVHADTGHRFGLMAAGEFTASDTLGWATDRLRSKVHALLAIKRAGATGPLRIRPEATQLVDLLPTIIDLLDLEPPDYPLHGRSIYGPDAGEAREVRFGFDPSKQHGPDIVEVRIETPSDLANSALTVVGPATDPNLWRAEVRDAVERAGGS